MRNVITKTLYASALCAALTFATPASESGSVDFGKFTPVEGSQFVEVNIKSNLIEMVTNLARKAEPEVAEVLKGLKQIRVNVLGLNDENREELRKRVTDIRKQLDGNGWDRIVTVMEGNEDVGVFVKLRGSDAIEGLVVTVIQGDSEIVLVNIVGDIQPEKLATVGERFNIEPLKKIKAAPITTPEAAQK